MAQSKIIKRKPKNKYQEEAEKEIAHWFTAKELFDYDPLHKPFTR